MQIQKIWHQQQLSLDQHRKELVYLEMEDHLNLQLKFLMNYDVKDIKLAKDGLLRIEWANQSMQVLNNIKKRENYHQPFKRHYLKERRGMTIQQN